MPDRTDSPLGGNELHDTSGLLHLSILLLPLVSGLFNLAHPITLANSIELPLVHFLFHELEAIVYALTILVHMVEPVFESTSLIFVKTKSKSLILLFHCSDLLTDSLVILPALGQVEIGIVIFTRHRP